MYKLCNIFGNRISDHHKLISTVYKSGSLKGRARGKNYITYGSFNIETFKTMLSDKLSRLERNIYREF